MATMRTKTCIHCDTDNKIASKQCSNCKAIFTMAGLSKRNTIEPLSDYAAKRFRGEVDEIRFSNQTKSN